jgi:hypothetical protein
MFFHVFCIGFVLLTSEKKGQRLGKQRKGNRERQEKVRARRGEDGRK